MSKSAYFSLIRRGNVEGSITFPYQKYTHIHIFTFNCFFFLNIAKSVNGECLCMRIESISHRFFFHFGSLFDNFHGVYKMESQIMFL